MFEEFKKFALGGSMVDMAVGIVVGAAFGTIVASLVEDIYTNAANRYIAERSGF